ncbi:hypothetical protein V2K41_22350, partial [Pseudomonas alliivorans]|nr:hypothetical protein [Pseudomonas alliivorans]
MEQSTPTSMRFLENTAKENEKQKAEGTYTRKLFEDVELHQKYDQEHFRFAQLPFTSQLWLHILQLGKIGCIIFPPILIYIHFLSISQSRESWQAVTLELLQEVYPIFLGIPLLCWGLGHVVVNHFPKIWFRPPKGPLWELNRRTGLVT